MQHSELSEIVDRATRIYDIPGMDRKDIKQEGYLVGWEQSKKDPTPAVIYAAIRKHLSHMFRRAILHRMQPIEEDVSYVQQDAARIDSEDVLESLAYHLSANEWKVIRGTYWYNQTDREIADDLKLSENAVECSRRRARRKLRNTLSCSLPSLLPSFSSEC